MVLDPETGDMLHDPHPSGAGVLEVDEVELIFAAQLRSRTVSGII